MARFVCTTPLQGRQLQCVAMLLIRCDHVVSEAQDDARLLDDGVRLVAREYHQLQKVR